MQDPLILVEGGDDAHFFQHFLWKTTGYPYKAGKAIVQQGSIEQLLKRTAAIDGDSNKIIAVICDADNDPAGRWRQLRERIGLQILPNTPPPDGSILQLPRNRRLGVWMMPDNLRTGTLETFLAGIRSEAAPQPQLWSKSKATVAALEHRLFAEKDIPKAELRTWLAWQKEPGASPGLAVTLDCFDLTHPLAVSLADWFRRLLPAPPPRPTG